VCPRRLLRNQGLAEERVLTASFKVITSCRVGLYVAPWEFAINYELHFAAGNHHAGISRPSAGECCLLPLLIEGLQSSCFATSRKPSELK
jgi:hypothetical protein